MSTDVRLRMPSWTVLKISTNICNNIHFSFIPFCIQTKCPPLTSNLLSSPYLRSPSPEDFRPLGRHSHELGYEERGWIELDIGGEDVMGGRRFPGDVPGDIRGIGEAVPGAIGGAEFREGRWTPAVVPVGVGWSQGEIDLRRREKLESVEVRWRLWAAFWMKQAKVKAG